MYHFWIQQLKCLCCFYHVRSSITYEEKHILSFYLIWPQQIHCIVENNSNGGVIHPFQHFTRQQDISPSCSCLRVPTTTFAANLSSTSLVISMENHILFFFDTISYCVDCILVARSKIILSQRGFGGNGMSCVVFQELSKTGGLYFM